jgi:S1-C subfamily serine protease
VLDGRSFILESGENPMGKELSAFSSELAAAVERAAPAVVSVNAREHVYSSGVVWRPDVVVTADHSVKREEGIRVTLPDGRLASATLIGRDPGTDLAVLRVEGAGLQPAEFGDPSPLKSGHLAMALARTPEGGLRTSMGIISATGPAWRTWRGGQIDQLIRLDVTLYPGFSGGALVDSEGRVAGINTSALARFLGTAIPISTVNRVVDELIRKGRIARGYLGVGMHPVRLPENLRSSLQLSNEGGVLVLGTQPDGPAAQAGILIGDILVALDGVPVNDTGDVHVFLDPQHVGKKIRASLIRGGASKELEITIGERPSK